METMKVNNNRQDSLSVLAKSTLENINKYWNEVNISPDFIFLKKPEVGMVMVRAQTSGETQQFNMGEMTVTRCVVRLESEEMGYGYVSGRNKEKSTLVALIDACSQVPSLKDVVQKKVIDPLSELQIAVEKKQEEKIKPSKVNFFTMVRGE
ncbi:MAG: phosphonate C-P lyase system protein PhnG [Cellvibrionaceae bacterium]